MDYPNPWQFGSGSVQRPHILPPLFIINSILMTSLSYPPALLTYYQFNSAGVLEKEIRWFEHRKRKQPLFYNQNKQTSSHIWKNAGHDMAIVGEPCNIDAHANILALLMTLLCPWLRNVKHRVRFVNVKSSFPENVVFSVCAHMGNAAYVILIMWNSISGLDTW